MRQGDLTIILAELICLSHVYTKSEPLLNPLTHSSPLCFQLHLTVIKATLEEQHASPYALLYFHAHSRTGQTISYKKNPTASEKLRVVWSYIQRTTKSAFLSCKHVHRDTWRLSGHNMCTRHLRCVKLSLTKQTKWSIMSKYNACNAEWAV